MVEPVGNGHKGPRGLWAVRGLLVIAFLILLPVAAAQEFAAVEVDVQLDVDLAGIVPLASHDGSHIGEENADQNCGSQDTTTDSDRFTFSEGETTTGCALYEKVVTPLPGARAIRVSFQMDRIVVGARDSVPDFPEDELDPLYGAHAQINESAPHDYPAKPPLPDFEQNWGIMQDDRNILTAFPLKKLSSPMEDFNNVTAIGPGNVTLWWYFGEHGQSGGSTPISAGVGDAASATVQDVQVFFLGARFPVTIEPVKVHDQDRVLTQTTYWVNFSIPEDVDGIDEIRLPGPGNVAAVGGVLPDGSPLLAEDVDTVASGVSKTFVLKAHAGQALTPGDYALGFYGEGPLEVPLEVTVDPKPTRLVGLFAGAVLAPLVVGAGGSFSVARFRREAEGLYVRTARAFIAGMVILALAFVAVAGTGIGHGWSAMETMDAHGDFSALALLVYMLLALLLIGFAVLWQTSSGGLRKAMAADLEQREAQAAELSRSNRELEQFAYVASHDLQEPLRKVASFTTLLKRRYAAELDQEGNEYIDYAVDGATRMQSLIEDLLAFSRAGRTERKMLEAVHLSDTVQQVLGDLSQTIEDAGGRVEVDSLPTVHADHLQMGQLFQNMISNAIKYHRPGEPPVVRLSAIQHGNFWRVTVQDNGIGIDKDHFDKVFLIFQRLHGRNEYTGTGIGLALCKKIVENHGGRIEIESEVGKGTAFHVFLPGVP